MNLEEMAAQLKTATTNHIVTLDEIKGYIQNRKILAFQNLFDDERQKEQAYKPFYMYDKKGRKQTGDEEIVFENHEYLVIRATKGWREPPKWARKNGETADWYHSVWVVGIDSGKPWIHRLEWDSNFESDDFEWTREYILKKMHFNASADEIQQYEELQIVRLQGDLTIEKLQTLEDKILNEKSYHIGEAKRKYQSEFEAKIKVDFAEEINQKYAPIEADALEAGRLEDLKERSKADQIQLRDIKKKYGITARTYLTGEVRGRRENDIISDILKRETVAQKHESALASHLVDVEKEFNEIFLKQESRQINLRFGNHLIIVEKGIQLRNNEILIIDENSPCFIIHDEHENRKTTLGAGVYRFGLLARHITDRR
jgi:hypothetical protein